ncbi:MAG TPA: Crp/Fnr family transcriptional regulator [Blastocatellia bacterium]|nr:Crp/Fnr family transcriptional regulator [Blastocatellia bacterium]HMX29374.1 Crp/Fnr family transcriptional regulator [Blastocatellia bacterium]HMY70463.1 Crp/Fnr family transcriptional regulator [Blastocatellia bacterium]HMZ19802.1 Crp/Fnr family transcriptional regulator [Blastocatellia bacterium]HNG29899.1 Crp/Fnr family transcriptional regulator [Blastocatellia bacterium]
MNTEKLAALRRTLLFGELPEAELNALADRAVERRLKRDEILFVAGDEAAGLFVIVGGALRAFREGVDGREQVIHVERAGATIAELPVFDDKPYPSTVAAEEDSTVLFIAKRDVKSLCLSNPVIALAALKLLAGRLRKCAELVEALSLREVDQRLARWLLAESRVRGKRTAEGLELTLVLTNQQIAARIGSVREVVSRALARLQNNGLIVVEGRRVTIGDEQALAVFADY